MARWAAKYDPIQEERAPTRLGRMTNMCYAILDGERLQDDGSVAYTAPPITGRGRGRAPTRGRGRDPGFRARGRGR